MGPYGDSAGRPLCSAPAPELTWSATKGNPRISRSARGPR